ncbi:MAG: acyl-CoA dehydrogenase family protein [Bacteroidota bacterium]
MNLQPSTSTLKGGEFLINTTAPESIFIPEEFNEDQQMIISMVSDFIKNKVLPQKERIENLDIELTRQLLEESGKLGIIGIPFPEAYGGSQMDFITSMILSELMSEAGSFSLSFGAHTGIGMLPLLYFGSEEQKQRYLPQLVAGTYCAAYCLTEPGSGSDALAAKSTAVLSEDGQHYVLNGQKMWITNGGFADLFTVFAKIDGEHFTGFLVERNWEGVSLGEEEKKLGIKGSSTRQVFFENVKVPVNNVLGKIGKGHKIAFNILNIGRIKLAAGAYGGCKLICTNALQYAKQRHQFGQSLSSFGAIQHKLAEQAIRIFANESASYRAANDIRHKEEQLQEEGRSLGDALLGAAEEYAIECALLKVTASECLDFTVDEGVQIYGGMGYSEEAPMAAAYRDARINRIFEGTNEINRMLSVDMLLKRGMQGHIDLISKAMAAAQAAATPSEAPTDWQGRSLHTVERLKQAFLMVCGATVQHFMQSLAKEQEVLMNLADIMADIYLAESTILRVAKLEGLKGEDSVGLQRDMANVFLDEAVDRVSQNCRRITSSWAEGEMRLQLDKGVAKVLRHQRSNAKEARRRIAAALIEQNAYCF